MCALTSHSLSFAGSGQSAKSTRSMTVPEAASIVTAFMCGL